MSIYLGETKITGTGVQVDGELSPTSNNPVANAPVSQALEDLGYDTWVKPDDWIDIRSASLKNSIYFLVAHAADYSSYRKWSIQATVSSGTYDVYIDGVKKFTTASATATEIDWQTLALSTGWDVTYPSSLRTHVVRITPTTSSATITAVQHTAITGQENQGTLWIHFSINNAIKIEGICHTSNVTCPILEAVTTNTGELEITGVLNKSFGFSSSLITLPKIIRTGTGNCNVSLGFIDCTKLKRLELENVNMTQSYNAFGNCKSLVEIKTKNCTLGNSYGRHFTQCNALRRIPDIIASNTRGEFRADYLLSVEPTVFDLSVNTDITLVGLRGSSNTVRADGVKGLIVSNSAPFTSTNSPQIDVRYTGMDRQALVTLFNSMPYNVGYTLVGSPTISSGVASGFSSSNYLSLPNSPTGINTYSYKITATINSIPSSGFPGIYSFFGQRAEVRNDTTTTATLRFYYPGENGTQGDGYFVSGVALNVPFSIEVDYDGNTTTVVIKQNNNVLKNTTISPFTFENKEQDIGRGGFDGSVDLNNTYINVNDVPFFTGAAATTKTCNVVGCTGTANLTQADKDIALNKGWSLTIS